MRKVDKLIYKAILPPFLIALLVLTFVVFVQELGKLSELLITHNASLGTIALIAGTVLPGILVFTLPLSFLIGTLIGLSGLSGESQVTALRSCGVPIRRLLVPILSLGLVVGAGTGFLSTILLPRTNDILFGLKDRISLRQATAQIQPRVFNEDFPNLVFYVDDLAIDRQSWERVFLVDNSDPESPKTVLARRGTWIVGDSGKRLQLHLENGTIYEIDPQDPAKDSISVFASTDIPLALSGGTAAAEAAMQARPKEAPQMGTAGLWYGTEGASALVRRDQLVELHRRLAIPFSVLGFSLLGLTLGICTRQGGRTSGFVLSLVLVLAFYVLFMNGLRLASVGKLPPWLGAWGADIILVLFGLYLLANAERGGRLTQCAPEWGWRQKMKFLDRALHLDAFRRLLGRIDEWILSSTGRIAGFRFPKVLDLYISRGFLVYFFWSILVCGALFVVLTLFDLLDDIIRNRVPVSYVVRYFIFLSPHIFLLIVPISVLLAVLIHFGIMEKSSEITAIKAGGWSLYRISLPVFLLSGLLCAGVYLMQDYILPYANIRQDSLRNFIKGKPAQTMRPQRKWIFGESDRIFNYDYFDAGQDLFVGLNVFEVDLRRLKILRRIHAARAMIGRDGRWILEDGWVHDFEGEENGFERLSLATFDFPEKPSYFKREIFEPKESSKLTYLQLKDYINYLQQAGYNATELQVELYKKISFPLSCFVMALLGIPFSFSMGKKGAFFGIATSIVIAMSYWGIFSVFEQMGTYGMLVPLLSAWAPNLLFGAAGLALLLTIRT